MLLAAVMILSILPMAVFSEPADTFRIYNGTPESEKDKNGGYIIVQEDAAKGDKVEVTVVPNDGYQLKTLKYIAVYAVRFDLNGVDGTAPETQNVVAGGKATEPAAPTSEDYDFKGWFPKVEDELSAEPWDFEKTAVTADVTLFAKWAEKTATVADVLSTAEEFPTAESEVSGAPENAWKTADDQICYLSYDGSKLFFYNVEGEPDKQFEISTDAIVSQNDDKNYVYTNGSVTVTFSMDGGALLFIIFAGTDNETWNGTYQSFACIAAGTMITLENGEQKPVEQLEIGEVIRTVDHETGLLSSAPVCFLWKNENAANAFTLTFGDEAGNTVKVTAVEEHGFYDFKEKKYVFINAENAKHYFGHEFYDADHDRRLELKSVEVLHERVDAYAIATSGHLNHLSNGMLSMCDGTFKRIANLFAHSEPLKCDAELKKKDIEAYGLTSLGKVLQYDGFNEADYYDYNLQYLDVAVGKGLITWKWVEALSEYCASNGIFDSMETVGKAKTPRKSVLGAKKATATKNDTESRKDMLQKMVLAASEPQITTPAEENCFPSYGKEFNLLSDGMPESEGVNVETDEYKKFTFAMPGNSIFLVAEFELIQPDWSDWEPFEEGKGRWTFGLISALKGATGTYGVKIRHAKENEMLKQLKIESWGKGVLTSGGVDILVNWNEATGEMTIPEQTTGCFQPSYSEYILIQDFNGFVGADTIRCFYDTDTKTFYFAIVYYISMGYFGYGFETLKMVPEGALAYDTETADFSAEFGSDDTTVSFTDGAALVGALDSGLKSIALYVNIESGTAEIPAGEYPINQTMQPGTVLASYGVIGNSVTYSFAGNRTNIGQLIVPAWFLVSGKVTVSYRENVMTMVVAAKNSYGKNIDVTITKVMPAKHTVTDKTTDENGSVAVNKPLCSEGDTVTLTVIPKDGYKLKAGTLKAVYDDGSGEKEVELTQKPAEKNKFTFVMPTADVTVTAEFEETEETFKAVWNPETGILSFFYDKLSHAGVSVSVFDGLATEATKANDWLYDGIRGGVSGVVIDESVAGFAGLKSTAYMFDGMTFAESITGAEYLKVDQVTNMAHMFSCFGDSCETIDSVPDVSGWNTGNVTNMSDLFYGYGFSSLVLDKVPDVSGWNTENVTDMSELFAVYGYMSPVLNAAPAVGKWNTGSVVNMKGMFIDYGNSSLVLNAVPDVGAWSTGNVTNMERMFQYYGYSSEELTSVPAIGSWNTENVTNAEAIFSVYGNTSEKLNFVLDLSGWNLSKAEKVNLMFAFAGEKAASWKVCIPYVTGALKNTPDVWYGKDDTVSAVPLTGKQFTLMYPVAIDENLENGKVEASSANAEANTTVTLTVTPDEGYMLKAGTLKAVYDDGTGAKELECKQDAEDETKYTFTMPNAPVNVTAEFELVQAQVIGLGGESVRNYPSLDEALAAAKELNVVKLLVDITDRTADITIPNGVILDLNNHVFKTTGTVVNGGVIEFYQKNAELLYDLVLHVPGAYGAGEEIKLPDTEHPDYILPKDAFFEAEIDEAGAEYTFTFALGDGEVLVWNKDFPAGVTLDVLYELALGGDIHDGNVETNRLTLNRDITIGSNEPDAEEAVIFVKTLWGDELFDDDIGVLNANGKKITLCESGKLIVSSNVVFDESVLVSGVQGKIICKKENKEDKTVTYFVHAHNLVKANGLEPTEDASGFMAYYECKDSEDACHAYFEDADGLIPIENLAAWKAEGGRGYLPKLEPSPKPGDASRLTLWMAFAILSAAGICAGFEFGGKRKRTCG